ncbi:MAG TPA: hypothetical protein VHA05_03380 [Candidatus Saccharimonadales bacterium]|nr:hypothetical protein [Candidatus Saccharimonadales bacterium]
MGETDRIHGLYTTDEYLRIHELGGAAIGKILEEHPSQQVADLCEIALNDYELHGAGDFIKKVLDTAQEQALAIRGSGYSYHNRGRSDEECMINAYIEIATTAYKTGQAPEYVTGVLDGAVSLFGEGGVDSSNISDVATAAKTTEQPIEYMETLAERLYAYYRFDSPGSSNPADDFQDFIDRVEEWGLSDDYAYRFAERLHQDSKHIEKPVNQAETLIAVATVGIRHFNGQHPEYISEVIREAEAAVDQVDHKKTRIEKLAKLVSLSAETEQPEDYVRKLLNDMRIEAAVDDDEISEIECLHEIIELADKTEQPEEYITELFEQGVKAALNQQHPRDTVRAIRGLLKAGSDIDYGKRRQVVLEPGIAFVRGTDSTVRFKHMLLNQLLRGFNVSEEALEANGLEARPSTRSFNFRH